MAASVPASVLDDASRRFHSPENISLGCLQVRGLFWPLSCDHFVRDYFELRHHLTRSSSVHEDIHASLGFPRVLRTADLYTMASVWEFKVGADHAQARMIQPNSFSHDTEWAEGAAVDSAAIRRAHAKNCTLVFHNVELYWRPIALLSLSLSRLFGVYSQANVYYSPPALAAALHAHQDAQSVFVVQCEGRKTWTLLEPPVRWKLRYNQRGKAGDTAPVGELNRPLEEITLEPGDVLFVPRGLYHQTSTPEGGEASLHVTIGAATDTDLTLTPTPTLTLALTNNPDSRPDPVPHPNCKPTLDPYPGPRPSPWPRPSPGVETDTDRFTWHALLADAAEALKLPDASQRLQQAQWHDERMREALPLPLCRPGGSFDAAHEGPRYLARARTLMRDHLAARPSAEPGGRSDSPPPARMRVAGMYGAAAHEARLGWWAPAAR